MYDEVWYMGIVFVGGEVLFDYFVVGIEECWYGFEYFWLFVDFGQGQCGWGQVVGDGYLYCVVFVGIDCIYGYGVE